MAWASVCAIPEFFATIANHGATRMLRKVPMMPMVIAVMKVRSISPLLGAATKTHRKSNAERSASGTLTAPGMMNGQYDHDGNHQGSHGQDGGVADGDRRIHADEYLSSLGALLHEGRRSFGYRNERLHHDARHHGQKYEGGGKLDAQEDAQANAPAGTDAHEDADDTAQNGRLADGAESLLTYSGVNLAWDVHGILSRSLAT